MYPSNLISSINFVVGLLVFSFLSPLIAQETSDSIYHNLSKKLDNSETTEDLLDLYDRINISTDVLGSNQKNKLLKQGFERSRLYKHDKSTLKFAIQMLNSFQPATQSNEEIDSMMTLAKYALRIATDHKTHFEIGSLSNSLGVLYLTKGEMLSALEYYHDALKHYKKSTKTKKAAYVISNISYIYSFYGDQQNAIKVTKEGLELSKKLPIASRNYNFIYKYADLTFYFLEKDEIDSSMYYFQKGLKLLDQFTEKSQIDNREELEFNLLQYGIELYLDIKDYVKAEEIYKRFENNIHFNSSYGIFLQMRYAKAKNDITNLGVLLKESPEYLRDTNLYHGRRYLDHSSYYYEKTGNYKKAFKDLKKVTELEQTYDERNALQYAEYMQSKIDFEEQKNEIELLTRENDLKSFQIFAILTGLIVLLIASVLYVIQNKKLKNKNLLLAEQSVKIDHQTKQIAREINHKENLFGNISHELRTPLTLISSSVSTLLNQSEDGSSQEKNLRLISVYNEQLIDMTNQILGLVKNSFHPEKLDKKSFKLKDLIEHIDNMYSQKAKSHNLKYFSQNLISSNQNYVTDVPKLLSIIKNLNENALKFSKNSGSITTTYLLDNDTLVFTIKDEGYGIAEEDIPFLFDRFYQASDNNRINATGIGLGLAICKENTELLSGSISVESQPDDGASFTIRIPLESDELEESKISTFLFPTIHKIDTHTLPCIKKNTISEDYVLIVDDNRDLCYQLNELLDNEHYLSFAHDGVQAIEQIKIKKPKIIITDWMMKGMAGDELVQYLKTHKAYSSIPVLMLSAKDSEEDKLNLLRIGVDSYICKPFIPENLKSQLNHLIDLVDTRNNENLILKEEGFAESDLRFLKSLEKITKENISNFEFKLGTVSERMNISLRQLNRKVRQLTGLTPMQYINEIRFEEAKNMLERGDYSTVKAVIYSVGFKAEKNFSRNFKKRYGKYPKDLLKQ